MPQPLMFFGGGPYFMSKWCSSQRKAFDVVIITTSWTLWKFHNNLVFGAAESRKSIIYDDVFDNVFFIFLTALRKVLWNWVC